MGTQAHSGEEREKDRGRTRKGWREDKGQMVEEERKKFYSCIHVSIEYTCAGMCVCTMYVPV